MPHTYLHNKHTYYTQLYTRPMPIHIHIPNLLTIPLCIPDLCPYLSTYQNYLPYPPHSRTMPNTHQHTRIDHHSTSYNRPMHHAMGSSTKHMFHTHYHHPPHELFAQGTECWLWKEHGHKLVSVDLVNPTPHGPSASVQHPLFLLEHLLAPLWKQFSLYNGTNV